MSYRRQRQIKATTAATTNGPANLYELGTPGLWVELAIFLLDESKVGRSSLESHFNGISAAKNANRKSERQ